MGTAIPLADLSISGQLPGSLNVKGGALGVKRLNSAVAKALGCTIWGRQTHCWRPENHTNGDKHPFVHLYTKRNRARCFVCDMRGGHSNVDMVMGVLGIGFAVAVQWIAERFPVPNVKPGRPVDSHTELVRPYRVGVHRSEWEVVARSGMWGAMTAAERSILWALDHFKDPDTGLMRISYQGLMRYAGVKARPTVSKALKHLAQLHANQVSLGR